MARAELADTPRAATPRTTKLSLVEARRQRCRQARYERYQAVVELGAGGASQLRRIVTICSSVNRVFFMAPS